MRHVATALAFALSMGVVAADTPPPADLIVTGGRVHTQDPAQPEAEAVAIRDGRFVFVGAAREAAAFRGPKTRVLDVAGATVFPGFIDAHAHLAWFGAHLDLVDLSEAASFDAVVTRVAERAARTPRGAWVLGRSWDQSDWPGKAFPSHAALSQAVPEHPVLLMRVDLHSVIVNRAALRLAGITKATADPPGGRILRDAQGEPTGVLVDAAVDLVQARVPATTKAQARAQVLAAQAELHRVGLTGIHDAGVPGPVIELLEEMAKAGELTLRDYVMVRGPGSVVPPGVGSETAQERPARLAADVARVLAAGPRRNIDGDHRLSVAAVKLAADGAMGSRGAAFLEPYDDDPGNSGYLLLSREQIRDVAVEALRHGVQVAVHAIGDRANRTVLDAFEDALRVVPKPDHRFRIEHASAVHPDDLARFARLGVIPSVQPSFVPSDGSWVTSRLGAGRIGEVYAFRALLDTGVTLPAGNDIPSETPSPLRTFHSALTRGGAENWPGESGGPKQRLTRDEALKQITVWPAFAAFQEDLVGSVTRGKLGDLTILAKDILTAHEDEILQAAVVATVVGGQVVYESPVLARRLIVGASVLDGSGAPARAVSVRLVGDRIAAVGELEPEAGEEIVNAAGLTLAPGFVDTHSHADYGLDEERDALGHVSQGITTAVLGQDGGGDDLAEGFAALERAPAAINIASYVGHNAVRQKIMGEDYKRPATPREIAAMEARVEAGMTAGALGLSTGLEYDPGLYSTTEEVIALAGVAARHGGRYISHIRSEDRKFWPALEELLRIGREAKLPVQVSHVKLAMTSLWGQAGALVERLDKARAEGIDVTADIYPYTYWQSSLTIMFPDRDFTNRAAADFALREIATPEGQVLAGFGPDPSYIGKTLAEVSRLRGTEPAVTLMNLIQEAEAWEKNRPAGNTQDAEGVIATSMDERDIARLLQWPHTNVCTDGGLIDRHPRAFGSFPRVLGLYARERGVLSLPAAVQRMTSLSAAHVGLKQRGLVAPGYYADLVLFDPARVADRASLAEPRALSVGIAKVWVAGQLVYAEGRTTGARPGRVLRRGRD